VRLSLDLPGLRPAFFPEHMLADIREIKRFRQLIRHAYDLVLREDRLRELVAVVERIDATMLEWCTNFSHAVRREQSW
jgi:hypothetical protein